MTGGGRARRAPAWRAVAWTAAIGSASLGGCGDGDTAIPTRVPAHRPADGLLGDTALQAVVEAQLRRAAAPLVAALGDERAAVRARAAFALGSVQAPEAVPALLGALSDASPTVRRDAVFALGQVGAPGAVTPLGAAFALEPDAEVRRRILQALGKIPAPRAATVLVGLDVPASLEAERTLALAVLGAVHTVSSPEALDHLLERLDALDPRLRAAAAYYFGRARQTGGWAAHAPRVRQALDGYATDDPAAMYLVQALGRLRDPDDTERLITWASTARDWRVRANAVTALGAPDGAEGGPDANPLASAGVRAVLLEHLDDPSGLVGVAAARALGRARPPEAEIRRIEAWIDAHPERVQEIEPLLAVLARGGERVYVLGWMDALPSDDVERRDAALRALAFLPGEEARVRLARAAREAAGSPRTAGTALESLVQRWPAERANDAAPAFYFEIFSAALRSGSVRQMATAAPILADSAFLELGSVDTLRAALERASGPEGEEVAGAIREVLRTLAGEDAPPPATGEATQEASEERDAAGATPAEDRPDPGALDWAYLRALGTAPRLALETERGRVVVQLATEEAPQTVQTIVRLAEGGRYDGVPFHRVVPNFVAQGGDVGSRDGYGGPGFTIKSEFTLIPYLRGVIGMASAGKDTEGSQFFLTHAMQPHLDGGYSAFGWVVEGMGVVDRLLRGDRIVRATVERGR
jgi:peptidylprolyl isomerase